MHQVLNRGAHRTWSLALATGLALVSCGPSSDDGGEAFEPRAFAFGGATCLRDEVGDVSCVGDADVLPVENPAYFEQWDQDNGWSCALSPVSVPELSDVNDIRPSCATSGMPTRSAWCWGVQYGESPPPGKDPGSHDFPESTVPIERPDLVGFVHLVDYAWGNCGLREAGILECVGVNRNGVLGPDNPDDWRSLQPVAELPKVTDASGSFHICAVDEAGQLWCWGHDLWSQLGLPPKIERHTTDSGVPYVSQPGIVAGIPAVRSVRVRATSTCALDLDGFVWCWGEDYGAEPQRVELPAIKDLGSECGISEDDEVWCWSATAEKAWPRLPGYRVRDLTGRGDFYSGHLCATDLETGRPICDGNNQYGQLGCGKIADCPFGHEEPCLGDLPVPD